MKISLIGMSGSGKSYWSQKLQKENGFKRFCCDDIIEQKFGNELKELGYAGLQDVAKWMGQPFDPQYKENSSKYLNFEKETMNEILEAIGSLNKCDEHLVIDTTGSVIYTGNSILQKLAQLTRVIYLDTPPIVQQEMYQLYLKDPKPVIWGHSFCNAANESNIDALGSCYPKLLACRSKEYKRIADVTFSYNYLHNPNMNVNKFIETAKND